MTRKYSGQYKFVRTNIAINPALIGEFTPDSMASFTAGWLVSGRRHLAKSDVREHLWTGMLDYFDKRLPGVDIPRNLSQGLPGIGVELLPVPINEHGLLETLVAGWPRFEHKTREMHIRLDHLWTPDTALSPDPPVITPAAEENPPSIHWQSESLFGNTEAT